MVQPKQGQLKPNVDISKTTPEVCDNCNGEAFREAFLLRKISALLTENGREGFVPVQVFACVKCGHVNEHFIPAELRPVKLVQP